MANPDVRGPRRSVIGLLSRFATGVALIAVGCFSQPAAAAVPGYQYVSPLPGARMVSPWNNVVIRQGRAIEPSSLSASLLTVSGSMSGPHHGQLELSDDAATLVFVPDQPFARGERVVVSLSPGIRTREGAGLPAVTMSFSISTSAAVGLPLAGLEGEFSGSASAGSAPLTPAAHSTERTSSVDCGVPPAGYPQIKLLYSDQPDSGTVFVSPFVLGQPWGRLLILDNAGQPLFYRRLPATAFDFKRQPNGLLTYFGPRSKFWGLDSSYAIVDSFYTGNGYTTDVHDLQVLPNGHALLMSYDLQPVHMDSIVPGGRADARVAGLIIQEIDQAKLVVFQWRSWDHFQITDTDSCLVSLRDSLIDYVHGNAVELDSDGNLLISSRSMNEITKIDRSTGEIMWRMGPHASMNQFGFEYDSRGWTGQHDIRRLPNGHITLFDNGNCLSGPYSRALEYRVDETNGIASLVWEHRNTPDTYGPFMGNVQRRSDGGTMIGWGGTATDPKLTDLHADGSKALQIGFASPFAWTYRAYRFPWSTTKFTLGSNLLDFGPVVIGQFASRPLTIHNPASTPLDIRCIVGSDSSFSIDDALPLTIPAGEDVTVTARFVPEEPGAATATLYVRAANDTELVAQPVVVTGTGVGPTLSVQPPAVTEGDVGMRTFEFNVTASFAPLRDVTVDYRTVDGSATAGVDYLAAQGTVVIPTGGLQAVFPVSVIGDLKEEQNETFSIQLSNVRHASLNADAVTGMILDDDGVITPEGGDLPTSYTLHPALPSPFSDATSIRFDLPRAGAVRIEIYDVRGRKVETLVDGVQLAGRHTEAWTARGQSSGVFFVRFEAGGVVQARRMVLLR